MARSSVRDLTGRIDLRRRMSRRRRLLTIVGVVLALVAAGTAVWVVRYSQVFVADQTRVTGLSLLKEADVLSAARVPQGRPLAQIDTQTIADGVAGLREVAQVRVSRQWPHTVAITVVERTPVFTIEYQGSPWLVDAQGVMYRRADKVPDGLLTATSLATNRELLADLATVVVALPDSVRKRATSIELTGRDTIVVKLTTGQRVMWGSADDSTLKGQVLDVLVKNRSKTGKVKIYDVSSPGNPTTR